MHQQVEREQITLFQNLLIAQQEEQYQPLYNLLTEIRCNDPYFDFKEVTHQLFNKCFLCKYAGILHSEVVIDRVGEREIEVKTCLPLPELQLFNRSGATVDQHSVDKELARSIAAVHEPYFKVRLYCPDQSVMSKAIDYAHKHG